MGKGCACSVCDEGETFRSERRRCPRRRRHQQRPPTLTSVALSSQTSTRRLNTPLDSTPATAPPRPINDSAPYLDFNSSPFLNSRRVSSQIARPLSHNERTRGWWWRMCSCRTCPRRATTSSSNHRCRDARPGHRAGVGAPSRVAPAHAAAARVAQPRQLGERVGDGAGRVAAGRHARDG